MSRTGTGLAGGAALLGGGIALLAALGGGSDGAQRAASAQACLGHPVYAPYVTTVRRAPAWPVPTLVHVLPTCAPTGAPPSTATGSPTAPATETTAVPSPTGTATASATATAPTPTPTIPAPPDRGLFGVQVFEADIEAVQQGAVNAAGARWARTRALWAAVEPQDSSPPARNWTMSDAVVGVAAAKKLKIILNLYQNPGWAATTVCGPVDRVPLQRFGAFVADVVERYDADGVDDAPGSPRVDAYELYNEPDFDRQARAENPEFGDPPDGYGGCFGHDPAAYADVLREGYRAVKASDPTAQVIFGAVAYDRFYDNDAFSPRGPFRYGFVQDVLRDSYNRYGEEADWPFFDTMAFHNYNDFRDNWDGAGWRTPEIIGKAAHFRENQLSVPGLFDLEDIPLITTEVGLASAPSDQWTERSETYQAAYVGQVMSRAMAAGLGIAIWYTTEDYATGACDNPYDWLAVGLLRSEWVADRASECPESPLPDYEVGAPHEPKPAHRAFAVASAALSGARYDRHLLDVGFAVEAHRLKREDGRHLLVAFTDTGDRLGRRGTNIVQTDFTVRPEILPGWTGRVRVTSYLGDTRVETGDAVVVPLDHRPTYIEVVP